MKKLIIILVMFAFVVATYAQADKTMAANDSKGSWLYESSLGSGDTIGAGDSTWYYTVYPNKGERLYYNISINIDSVGGTGGVANLVPVILQGRDLSSDSFTNIDTIAWTGSASATNDTTIRFTQETTAQFYTEYRLSITAANDSFRALIDWIKFRFYK